MGVIARQVLYAEKAVQAAGNVPEPCLLPAMNITT
jgi:hypothetical protein